MGNVPGFSICQFNLQIVHISRFPLSLNLQFSVCLFVPRWRGQGVEVFYPCSLNFEPCPLSFPLACSTVGISYKTIPALISFQHLDINEYNVAFPPTRTINGLAVVGILYKRADNNGK
jgi:hypothetical protein